VTNTHHGDAYRCTTTPVVAATLSARNRPTFYGDASHGDTAAATTLTGEVRAILVRNTNANTLYGDFREMRQRPPGGGDAATGQLPAGRHFCGNNRGGADTGSAAVMDVTAGEFRRQPFRRPHHGKRYPWRQ
jgi:hypothetical protein